MTSQKNRKDRSSVQQSQDRQVGPKTLLCMVSLLSLTAVSAIGVIYSTHKNRHLLNELQQLERQRNGLQVEWGQLLLEQSSLVSQGRIENLAIAELGMKIPATENVVVVSGE